VSGSSFDRAYQVLRTLAEEAAQKNVKANIIVGLGSSWERLKEFHHDLVITGTELQLPALAEQSDSVSRSR